MKETIQERMTSEQSHPDDHKLSLSTVPVCNEAAAATACCRKASLAAVTLGALSISWSLLEKVRSRQKSAIVLS